MATASPVEREWARAGTPVWRLIFGTSNHGASASTHTDSPTVSPEADLGVSKSVVVSEVRSRKWHRGGSREKEHHFLREDAATDTGRSYRWEEKRVAGHVPIDCGQCAHPSCWPSSPYRRCKIHMSPADCRLLYTERFFYSRNRSVRCSAWVTEWKLSPERELM